MLTQQRLKDVLHYDPATGVWTWRTTLSVRAVAGTVAGTRSHPHKKIGIDGRRYYAHRLAVLYVTGVWPKGILDHRNNNPSDNTWVNIRPATKSQNAANTKRRTDNTSGFKGVFWNKKKLRWTAVICVRGRQMYLGSYIDKVAAHAAYVTGAVKYFGAYARAV